MIDNIASVKNNRSIILWRTAAETKPGKKAALYDSTKRWSAIKGFMTKQ